MRPLLFSTLFFILALASRGSRGEVLIDDFSTVIQANGLTGGFFVSPPPTVLHSGGTASWTDNGSGIVGGFRKVRIGNYSANGGGGGFVSATTINGVLAFNNPAGVKADLVLTYDAGSSLSLDITAQNFFRFDIAIMDQTAIDSGSVGLTITDVNDAIAFGTFALTSASIGTNEYSLASLVNYGSLVQSEIKSVVVSLFSGSEYGMDLGVRRLSLHPQGIPEPTSFAMVGATILLIAGGARTRIALRAKPVV